MALKLAVKAGIVTAAVYWTNQLEIWSTLSSKSKAYDQLIAGAKCSLNQVIPKSLKYEVPAVLKSTDMCATTNYYYNKGVTNAFEGLVNLPKTVGNLYSSAAAKLNAKK